MRNKTYAVLSLLVLAGLTLAACQPAGPAPTEEPPEPTFTACQVTDVGGIDDQSFNATAWKGMQDAEAQLGIEAQFLESQQQADYETNINAFVEEGCDIIVTVGFLLGDATAAGAEANPGVAFSIVDFAYDPTIPNVLGQVFETDEAAFLAGYVAAATTQTGAVGTFGGIQIPPVTVFMDGFALGVQYYNEQKGTDVQVLGWDPVSQTGLFTGNFESTDDGRRLGESLMDEGADIIMPVAGPVGLGTAAAAQERGEVYIIGVDNDWAIVNSQYADVTLTSVLKNMDVTTFEAIQAVIDGTFAGGVTVGTLANGGVGLAPFHELDAMVSADLQAEVDQVRQMIIDGAIQTLYSPEVAIATPGGEGTQPATTLEETPSVEYVEGEVLLEEDFEDRIMEGWVLEGAGWSLVQDDEANYILEGTGSEGSGPWIRIGTGDSTWENYAFEFKAIVREFDSPPRDTYFSLDFRALDPGCSEYTWTLSSGSVVLSKAKGCIRLPQIDQVRIQTLKTVPGLWMTEGAWTTLRVEVLGDQIRGYVNGRLVLEEFDATDPHRAGGVGLAVPPTNVIWFDDIRVVELIPAE